MNGISVAGLVRRGWTALVAVLVVLTAGFGVYRLHGIFGSADDTAGPAAAGTGIVPFHPKRVSLEVFGGPGAVATINYLDGDAQPRKAVDAALPWSYTITTTAPAVVANLVAQGDGGLIGCRITVDGVVTSERTVTRPSAYTFCVDKSA